MGTIHQKPGEPGKPPTTKYPTFKYRLRTDLFEGVGRLQAIRSLRQKSQNGCGKGPDAMLKFLQ
jgi:hypothetical protein